MRGRLSVQTETGGKYYRGMGHAFVTVAREEGVRALFRGWLPSVIGVVPYAGMNFAVYETAKDGLLQAYGLSSDRELSHGAKLGAGYWKNYGPRPGCTIGVPNEPIPIDKALSAA